MSKQSETGRVSPFAHRAVSFPGPGPGALSKQSETLMGTRILSPGPVWQQSERSPPAAGAGEVVGRSVAASPVGGSPAASLPRPRPGDQAGGVLKVIESFQGGHPWLSRPHMGVIEIMQGG